MRDNSPEINTLKMDIQQMTNKFNLLASIKPYVYLNFYFDTNSLDIFIQRDGELIFDRKIKNFFEFLKNLDSIDENQKTEAKSFIQDCRNGKEICKYRVLDNILDDASIYSTLNLDEQGRPHSIFGVIVKDDEDFSQVYHMVEDILNYDTLTGLPNKGKFIKTAKEMLERFPNDDFVILYSDINNFKYINDTYGYLEGDRILREFAHLISKEVTAYKAVCRVNSDKFLSMVKLDDRDKLREKVLEVNTFFHYNQRGHLPGVNVTLSTGGCIVNRFTGGVTAAIDNANTARKAIKVGGKADFILYNDFLEGKIFKEMDIVTNMEQALTDQEFKVFLQPKIAFSDGSLIGAEALVRWIKTDGAMVFPNDFIPVFEKNGFITNLDFYVYEQVFILLRNWLDRGITPMPLSVNVSRAHIKDTQFAFKMKALADRYEISPELIEIELTESIFLSDVDEAIWLMEQLKAFGFYISIDDFGSGFSSLNLLKDLPADVLKIDKEFFSRDILRDKDKIIVSSVVSLAKKLDMLVLCEGVETESQVEFLKSINCDIAQGYYFSKAIPTKDYETDFLLAKLG